MKISRRKLVLGAAALSQSAAAQVAGDALPDSLLQEARDANRRNAEALAKVDVAVTVEPAFQFRA